MWEQEGLSRTRSDLCGDFKEELKVRDTTTASTSSVYLTTVYLDQWRSTMKVRDAMHKGVDWVGPDTPVTDLAKLMRKHDIGAIPIGENDQLIGMVTDRDIVCKGLAEDGFDVRRATAREVMTPGIHCCREDDDLAKAVRHMEELKVRRLPVINKGKRMVGILSLGDVSRSAPSDLLSEMHQERFGPSPLKHGWCHSNTKGH